MGTKRSRPTSLHREQVLAWLLGLIAGIFTGIGIGIRIAI